MSPSRAGRWGSSKARRQPHLGNTRRARMFISCGRGEASGVRAWRGIGEQRTCHGAWACEENEQEWSTRLRGRPPGAVLPGKLAGSKRAPACLSLSLGACLLDAAGGVVLQHQLRHQGATQVVHVRPQRMHRLLRLHPSSSGQARTGVLTGIQDDRRRPEQGQQAPRPPCLAAASSSEQRQPPHPALLARDCIRRRHAQGCHQLTNGLTWVEGQQHVRCL